MHAGRLIDHVEAGQAGHHQRAALLIAGLRVGHLRIRHAGRGTTGKIVILQHLRAGRRQQPLLARTARHRAGTKVRDKRPGADNAGMTRSHRIDIDEACNNLGKCLGNGPGDSRRRGGPGLTGRQQQNRHAGLHRLFHHLAGFGGKAQWRHHEAVAVRDERAGTPLVLATGNVMEHRHSRSDIGCFGKTGSDMLGRSLHRRIDGIEIESCRILDVARHHRPLEKMYVVHLLNDAGRVIDVGKVGFAIGVVLGIDDMNSRPGSAVMHARTRQQHVMLRVLAVKRDISRRLGQHVVDKRPREADTPVIAGDGTDGCHIGDARVGCLTQADFLENLVHRIVDRGHRRVIQRPVLTTGKAGADRTQLLRQRSCPYSAPRSAASGPTGRLRDRGKEMLHHRTLLVVRGAPAQISGRTWGGS